MKIEVIEVNRSENGKVTSLILECDIWRAVFILSKKKKPELLRIIDLREQRISEGPPKKIMDAFWKRAYGIFSEKRREREYPQWPELFKR